MHTARPYIFGSCCVCLHTTANTIQHLQNQQLQTMLGVVRTANTIQHLQNQQLPTLLEVVASVCTRGFSKNSRKSKGTLPSAGIHKHVDIYSLIYYVYLFIYLFILACMHKENCSCKVKNCSLQDSHVSLILEITEMGIFL